ncbi:MAG: integrase arm-type DNA-binding domain-containing protein [Albidovulum sp.]
MSSGKLTVSKVRSIEEPGRYSDGNCLYLVVAPGGTKSWISRLTIRGKQTDLGLGGVSYVTLAEAREEAARLRRMAKQGKDPRGERERDVLTFEDAARRVHEGLKPTFKSEKHAALWLSSLQIHVLPRLGYIKLQEITSADILAVLQPIWTEKHDTARRVKQRMATVFDWAKGSGHLKGENPITGIKRALPTVKRQVDHMAALPWKQVPAFMADLRERDAVSARCLEFLILTAGRSNEGRGARWSEIHDTLWKVPGERMKRGGTHEVPLGEATLDVLERVRGLDADLLFPSPNTIGTKQASPLSINAFRPLLARMGHEGMTVHGFRSSFRDWAADYARADREVAEACLAHVRGDQTERAYARSSLLERRRSLMDAWGRYCVGDEAQVIEMPNLSFRNHG